MVAPQTSGFPGNLPGNHLELSEGVNCNNKAFYQNPAVQMLTESGRKLYIIREKKMRARLFSGKGTGQGCDGEQTGEGAKRRVKNDAAGFCIAAGKAKIFPLTE